MTIGWHFNNTYSKLSDTFREKIKPIPVTSPELVLLNESLASELLQVVVGQTDFRERENMHEECRKGHCIQPI